MSGEEESGSEDEVALTPGQRIAALYLSEHMADVHFTFTDQHGSTARLPAHKLVLSTASLKFFTQLCGPLPDDSDIHIDDLITADTFKLLLKYIYCGTVQLDREQAPKLLCLAKKYLMRQLKIECRTFLKSQLHAYSDWCLHLLQYLYDALGESKSTLMQIMLQLIEKHGRTAVTSDAFLCLSAQVVLVIVRRDALNVDELTLFRMVINWSKRECERRELPVTLANQRAVLHDILPHIRFTAASLDEFRTMMLECRVLTNDAIVDVVLAVDRTTPRFLNCASVCDVAVCGACDADDYKLRKQVYIMGGYVDGSSSVSVRTYSLDTGCQLTTMTMNKLRAWHCAAYCHTTAQLDQIVLIGGSTFSTELSAEKCTLSDHSRVMLQTMPMERRRHAASCISIGNKVYIFGGWNCGRKCECYDVLLDTWTDIAPLPHPVGYACCVLLEDDGKTTVLVIGGAKSENTVVQQTVQQYDPDENQWTDRIDLRLPTTLHCAAAVNWKGNVVVIGGATEHSYGGMSNDCYSMDNVTKQWVSMPKMKAKRWGHAAVVLDDKIVVMGGMGSPGEWDGRLRLYSWDTSTAAAKPLNSVEVYDGEQWTYAANLYAPMFGFAALVI